MAVHNGASFLRPQLESILEQLRADDELIVVCGCAPDGSDARRVCRLLQQRGLSAVCLEGGLQGWLTHGLPTESHLPGDSASDLC